MTKKSNHVVPTLSGGWSVKKLGTSKAIRNFDSQEKAIEYGQKLSQNQKTDFYIHKKNGMVQNKYSFSTNKS